MSISIYPQNLRGLTWSVAREDNIPSILQSAPSGMEVALQQAINPIRKWTLTYEYMYGYGSFVSDKTIASGNPNYPYSDLEILEGFWKSMGGQADDFLFYDPNLNHLGPGVLNTNWAANTYYGPNVSVYDGSHWQNCIKYGQSGNSTPSWNHSGLTTNDGTTQWIDKGIAPTSGSPPVLSIPNLLYQLQVWSDGAGNYYSPIQRWVGGQFFEDITDLNPPHTSYSGGIPSGVSIYADGVLQDSSQVGVYGPGLSLPLYTSGGLYLRWTPTSPPSPPATPVTITCDYLWRVRFGASQQGWEEFMSGLYTLGGSNSSQGSSAIQLRTSRPIFVVGG